MKEIFHHWEIVMSQISITSSYTIPTPSNCQFYPENDSLKQSDLNNKRSQIPISSPSIIPLNTILFFPLVGSLSGGTTLGSSAFSSSAFSSSALSSSSSTLCGTLLAISLGSIRLRGRGGITSQGTGTEVDGALGSSSRRETSGAVASSRVHSLRGVVVASVGGSVIVGGSGARLGCGGSGFGSTRFSSIGLGRGGFASCGFASCGTSSGTSSGTSGSVVRKSGC